MLRFKNDSCIKKTEGNAFNICCVKVVMLATSIGDLTSTVGIMGKEADSEVIGKERM